MHAYARPHSWLGRPNYQERLDAALDDAKATIRELRDDSGGPLARVAQALLRTTDVPVTVMPRAA